MRRAWLLSAALATLVPGAGSQDAQRDPGGVESCSVCHGAEGLEFARGVHGRAGIGCIDCHGGSAGWLDAADAHGDDLRPLSDSLASVEACAACHSDIERMRGFGLRTDQESLYWSSFHGRKLAEDGDPNVATCVSCHGAHGILRSSDPRALTHKQRQPETCGACHSDAALMEPYGLDTSVVDEFRGSVHGRSLLEGNHLANPACADCHGAHGAMPPRVEEVGRVCGQCHTLVRQSFEESPHFPAVKAGRMEECVSCHGSHGVRPPAADMLLGADEGHCGACHDAETGTALAVARSLHDTVAAMDAKVAGAEEELRVAATRGLFVGSMLESLDDARGLRVRARPLLHSLSPDTLDDLRKRADGMVNHTLDDLGVQKKALRDRKIYTGIFFGVVMLLAAGLLAYRREAFDRVQEASLDGPDTRSGD